MNSLKSRLQRAAIKFGKDRQEYKDGAGYQRLLEFSRAVHNLEKALSKAMNVSPPSSSGVLDVANCYVKLVAQVEPELSPYPQLETDAEGNDKVANVLFEQCQADMPNCLDMLGFISDLAASVKQVQTISQGMFVEGHLETLLRDECETLAGKLEQLCFVVNKIKESGSL